MARLALVFRVSVSVAVTVEALAAEAAAEFTNVAPVAADGTVPASWRGTDWPTGIDARVQVSVPALNVTPAGRLGLLILVSPWAGRLSTTLTLVAADGPELETT